MAIISFASAYSVFAARVKCQIRAMNLEIPHRIEIIVTSRKKSESTACLFLWRFFFSQNYCVSRNTGFIICTFSCFVEDFFLLKINQLNQQSYKYCVEACWLNSSNFEVVTRRSSKYIFVIQFIRSLCIV